jgi:hypothetical protein
MVLREFHSKVLPVGHRKTHEAQTRGLEDDSSLDEP